MATRNPGAVQLHRGASRGSRIRKAGFLHATLMTCVRSFSSCKAFARYASSLHVASPIQRWSSTSRCELQKSRLQRSQCHGPVKDLTRTGLPQGRPVFWFVAGHLRMQPGMLTAWGWAAQWLDWKGRRERGDRPYIRAGPLCTWSESEAARY
jgi:hypothetical protein